MFASVSTAIAQATPTIDAPFIVSLLLRVLHIFSAILLVGGIFYQRTILRGKDEQTCFGENRALWARWVGIATFLLLGTGLYNFMSNLQQAKAAGSPLPLTYHALFGIKFVLGLGIMFLAAILAGKTDAAKKFRKDMPRWLNIAWMASLAVIVLAGFLRALH